MRVHKLQYYKKQAKAKKKVDYINNVYLKRIPKDYHTRNHCIVIGVSSGYLFTIYTLVCSYIYIIYIYICRDQSVLGVFFRGTLFMKLKRFPMV